MPHSLSSVQKRGLLVTALMLGTLWLAGCSTTHEMRPTASVMVGAQTGL